MLLTLVCPVSVCNVSLVLTSQNRISSPLPVASMEPSGLNEILLTVNDSLSSVSICSSFSPVLTSHRNKYLFASPSTYTHIWLASIFPSGLNDIEGLIPLPNPDSINVCSCLPVFTFDRNTVLSRQPTASVFPSGLNTTLSGINR